MKEKVKTKYYGQVQKILEWWKYNNLPFQIGPELEQMGRRTRELMTMHWALNPKSVVAKIYLSQKQGRRGLISVESKVKWVILGLEK